MQRYTVTIVSSGTSSERPVLLVPFQPSAAVTAFVDELFKRIERQGLAIAPNTHVATLHLDSETGGLIDVEDVLSDVVLRPESDKIFAVFSEKNATPSSAEEAAPAASTNGDVNSTTFLKFRVITPANAKTTDSCPVLSLSVTATIRQLHDSIADELKIPRKYEEDADTNECNCELAKKLADGTAEEKSFLVVHGKSCVERLNVSHGSDATVKAALRARFGDDIETKKKTTFSGAEIHPGLSNVYRKNPVAAICSNNRHTPVHARVEADDIKQKRSTVLDLHTSEMPIHPASMDASLEDVRLGDLAIDGLVDIYCVNRRTTGSNAPAIGKSSIFRTRAHWEPSVAQSKRGMAMFLSSLRVFASLVQDMNDDERSQDAVLHAFDLLTQFPPALRTVYILTQGKTPTPAESAALAQTMYEVMDGFLANFTDVIGTDHTRVFEGARLFFGFILDKSKALRLSVEDGKTYPYLTSFPNNEIRSQLSGEAVMRAINTSSGLVEGRLFEYFKVDGLLERSHLQPFMAGIPTDNVISRVALLSAGTVQEVIVFSKQFLTENYRYADGGKINAAIDIEELADLDHLAEICARNKLSVHRPRQLSSAVAPCLTFDRNGHLAVYTGEQPCGGPGGSSMLFRPHSGEETIDTAVIEQLIASIIATYEAEGTAVFDALGGATVPRQQTPDEVTMFVVDTSASMRGKTDFEEVNDMSDSDEDRITTNSKAQALVENELYGQVTFDDMKEHLCKYEGFNDMLAIIGSAASYDRRSITTRVLDILRTILSCSIVKKAETLSNRRRHASGFYHLRHDVAQLERELKEVKLFWAGLKTHEEPTIDFLIYRATSTAHDISRKWTWTVGEETPAAAPPFDIPDLPANLVELPHHLRCPVSHNLMLDAVKASDGFTYSHAAIAQWFTIRKSSPMTGLPLQDVSLRSDEWTCDLARGWMNGSAGSGRDNDEQPAKRFRFKTPQGLKLTFDSREGSFSRTVTPTASLLDLYNLAFRGLKGRFVRFQLATERYGPLSPTPDALVTSRNIHSSDHIHIRIPEDDPAGSTAHASDATNNERVLVKVYLGNREPLFGYWTLRDNTQTVASVIWKFWRHRLGETPHCIISERHIWTCLSHSGDGLLTGQPFDTNEKMTKFFNRQYCLGQLGEEEVYQEDDEDSQISGRPGPLVLKVQVDTPHQPKRERTYLSRLDVLKQMFEALINRTLAYNYKTHVGLVTFASTPKVTMGISHVLENFRRSIGGMQASGDTALWDALALAKDQLLEYGKKYSQAKLRIICISDGNDTKSINNTAAGICWGLREANITVDSVSLGNADNEELTALSFVLGSYRFHPMNLTNALAICELEPFLSLMERPAPTLPTEYPRDRIAFIGKYWRACQKARFTVVNEHTFPERKTHPNLLDSFIQLTDMPTNRPPAPATGSGSTRSNLRTSRLMNEIRATASNGAHPKYDVYVSESDMSFWKVVMSGPDGSPYSPGTFLLYLHADEGYPTFAPKARFVTRIKHPNVNTHGRVCHSIFDRDWMTDISMTTLLDSIYGLLLQPEHSDPVNTTTTLGFHHDQVEFADECRLHVGKYAAKDRAWWKAEVLGEGHDGEDEHDHDSDANDDENPSADEFDEEFDEDFDDEPDDELEDRDGMEVDDGAL